MPSPSARRPGRRRAVACQQSVTTLSLPESLGSGQPMLKQQGPKNRDNLYLRLLGWLVLALVAPGFTARIVGAAGTDKPASAPRSEEWLQSYLALDSQLPFSFVYGRRSSSEIVKTWARKMQTRSLDGARTEHVVTWTDPKTQLQVRLTALNYAGSAVVEWTLLFKNAGNADTPILEELQALDVSVPVLGGSIPTLLYSRGAAGMDTYSLQRKSLNQLEDFRMSNPGGGKTGETIPFFDIRMNGRGLIGAVGWAGQWAISFSRPTEAAIDVRAGMSNTHFSLHPGEGIRTPLILSCLGKAMLSMPITSCAVMS